MARTMIDIRYTHFETARDTACNMLSLNNYTPKTKNGEYIWQNGIGFWTAKKFIKLEFLPNNILRVWGWVQPVGFGEMDLEGSAGAIPKKSVRKLMQQLQISIH